VLTHKEFIGPFYVSECVQGRPDIGMSYRLVDVKTGRQYPYLVTSDRLKPYNQGRLALQARLSQPTQPQGAQSVEDSEQTGEREKVRKE